MALLLQTTHQLDQVAGKAEMHISSELVRHAEILGVPHIHPDRPLRMASTHAGMAFLLFVDNSENLCVTWQSDSGARWEEAVLREHAIQGMVLEDFDSSVDAQGALRIVVLYSHAGKQHVSECQIPDPGAERFQAGADWHTVELPLANGMPIDGLQISIQHSSVPSAEIATIVVATNGETMLVNRYGAGYYEDMSWLIANAIGRGHRIKSGGGFFGYMKLLDGRIDQQMGFCLTYENDGRGVFLTGLPDVPLGMQCFDLPDNHVCTALAPVFNLLFSGGQGLAFSRYDPAVLRFSEDFTPVTGIDVTLAPGFDRISQLWVSEHVESGEADSLVGQISIWARAHATLNGREVSSVIHLLAHVDHGRVTFSDPVALGRDCVSVAPVISSSEHKFCAITADGSLRHRELDLASGLWKDSHIALRPVQRMQSQIAYATSLTVTRDGKPLANEAVELTPNVGCSLKIHDGSGPNTICGWAEAGEAIQLLTDRRGQIKIMQATSGIASPEYTIRLQGGDIRHQPGKQSYDVIAAHGDAELRAARFSTGPRSDKPVFGAHTDFKELSSDIAALAAAKPHTALLRLRRVKDAPSVFEKIANFLHEFSDWLEHCVVEIAEKVCSVLLKIAGQVYTFVVQTVEEACHALSAVLKKVAVALGEVLGWLGCELLGLNRTTAIQSAVSGTLFNALHSVHADTDRLGDYLKAKVEAGRSYLDHELDRLIADANQHGIHSVKEKTARISSTVHSPALDPSCYGVNPLDLLHLGEPEVVLPETADVSEVLNKLFSRLGDDLGAVGDSLSQLVLKEVDQLAALFQPDASGSAAALGMVKALVDAIAHISTTGIDAVVALFDALLELIPLLLNAEIRFAPFEALIGFLGGMIGAPELKPTLLNFFSVVPCMLTAAALKIFQCPGAELDRLKPMAIDSLFARERTAMPGSDAQAGWDVYQKVAGLLAPFFALLGDGLFSLNYALNGDGFAAGLAGVGSSVCYLFQGACSLSPLPDKEDKVLEMIKFGFSIFVASALAVFAAATTLISFAPARFKKLSRIASIVLNIMSILLAAVDMIMNTMFMIWGLVENTAQKGAKEFNIVLSWITSLAFDIAAFTISVGGFIKDPSQETKLVVLSVAGIATATGTGLGVANGVLGFKGEPDQPAMPGLSLGYPANIEWGYGHPR